MERIKAVLLKIVAFVFILFVSRPAVAQLAGTVDPNATTIVHVTEFFPFHEGLAVMRNGSQYAVIDPKGTIIIPYNKYQIDHRFMETGFQNGMCMITDETRKTGYIDKQGKLVFPVQFFYANQFQKEGFAYAHIFVDKDELPTRFILRKDGTKISFTNRNAQKIGIYRFNPGEDAWSEGLNIVEDFDFPNLAGYMNSSGKIVIPRQFLAARPFSDGLAAVAKKDDFGNLKWGFINHAGQVVIPFQFSNEPFPFSDGVSIIKPLDIPDFKYAFIDKTGTIIHKILELENGPGIFEWDPPRSIARNSVSFVGGWSVWPSMNEYKQEAEGIKLISKNGKTVDLTEKIKEAGYAVVSSFHKIVDGKIRFIGKHADGSSGYGVIDLEGNIVVPPIFSGLHPFDPISKLAYAEIKKGDKLIQGYINLQGVFVIIRGEKTGF